LKGAKQGVTDILCKWLISRAINWESGQYMVPQADLEPHPDSLQMLSIFYNIFKDNTEAS
jgi:hypothetical protein